MTTELTTYELRKAAGICPNCREAARPGRVFCATCSKNKNKPEHKLAAKLAMRDIYADRKKRGVCVRCEETELVTETLCATCRAAANALATRGRAPSPTRRCGTCGATGTGHNARTCPRRGSDVPTIDYYASLRPGRAA